MYTLSGRPAHSTTILVLHLVCQGMQGSQENLLSSFLTFLQLRWGVSRAAFIPVIASIRSDTARSSPCRLSCRMASAAGGTPASAMLRRTSASSPVVEADAPEWISLARRGCPIVLPAVLLAMGACAGRSGLPAVSDALFLLRSVGAVVSGCCILTTMLQCLHPLTSFGAWQDLKAAGSRQ